MWNFYSPMLILLIFSLMKFIFNYLVDFFIIYSSMCYDSCVSLISRIYVNCSFLVNFIHVIIISPIWPIALVWLIHEHNFEFICPLKIPSKIWISLVCDNIHIQMHLHHQLHPQTMLSIIHYLFLSKVMLHPHCHQQTLFFTFSSSTFTMPLSSLFFPLPFHFALFYLPFHPLYASFPHGRPIMWLELFLSLFKLQAFHFHFTIERWVNNL